MLLLGSARRNAIPWQKEGSILAARSSGSELGMRHCVSMLALLPISSCLDTYNSPFGLSPFTTANL